MKRLDAAILLVPMVCFCTSCRTGPAPGDGDRASVPGTELNRGLWTRLQEAGWRDRVGTELGLWVSVTRQELIGIQEGRVRLRYSCSTAAKGTGSRTGSNRTPLGWHEIQERYGDGLPIGAIFNERKYTGKVWNPRGHTKKDLILSRIMWLRGLERGLNTGPGIDSHERYIYIHGTPAEEMIGRPASMGCIRLRNADVVQLYDQTAPGTRVLITDW